MRELTKPSTESLPEHAHLDLDRPVPAIPLSLGNLPRLLSMGIIRLYQKTLSRAMPPGTCRFHPSCSHYAYEALGKHGFLRGGFLAVKRILRCQPFHPGGYDPVP